MIEIKNISFGYQEAAPPILNDLSLDIAAGLWLTIIGANGSGKSTLARHLNGLLLPFSGDVFIDGLNSKEQAALWQIRQRVAFVFQNPDNQLIASSVEDDIVFGPENLGLSRAEIAKRLEDVLKICGLESKRAKAPYQLSGGEKQKVAIAGALAMQPNYMVLDEPTSMLDPILRKTIIQTLQKLHQQLGMGIIYITNIMEEALLAERIIVLANGHVIKDGSPQQVFSNHQFLLEQKLDIPPISHIASLLKGQGLADLDGILTIDDFSDALAKLPKPKQKAAASIIIEAAEPNPIIEINDLCYAYQKSGQKTEALHNFTISFNKNKLTALIGHSGSGKSTLMQLIAGLIPPKSGHLKVAGQDSSSLKKGAVFKDVGLVFQYPEQQLFAETVFEEIAFGPRNLGIAEENIAQVVEKALAQVGLDYQQFKDKSPFNLSGGQKRRICIASILAMNNQIIIFDEPTAGLDEAGRKWMINLAQTLLKDGKTILWVSHNMEEVAELADYIAVLNEGNLFLYGSPQQVFAKQQQLEAINLDIPLAAKLIRNLQDKGYLVAGQAITAEQAAAEIAALWRPRGEVNNANG